MRDKTSIGVVSKLHPYIREEVKELIDKVESHWPVTIAVRVVQGLRTFDQQDQLYAQGRTKPGNRVTNSKGGQSYHNYGLAIDFAILYDKDGNGNYETLSWDVAKDFNKDGESDWLQVVEVFEKANYTWGGRFNSIIDQPHLEKTKGFNWRQLLAKHNAKDYITGTNYVNI